MWYKSENGNSTKPSSVDNASSLQYVYVRKDFELIAETEEVPAHWQYMEQKVSKEDWSTYQQIIENASDISDVNDALMELAEIIGG